MGFNPANFAYWIGEELWVPGYLVYYAISFYDERSGKSPCGLNGGVQRPALRNCTAGSASSEFQRIQPVRQPRAGYGGSLRGSRRG